MATFLPIPEDRRFQDFTGQRFGMVTVLGYVGRLGSKERGWTCQCSCGTYFVARSSNLATGNTRSCGCVAREAVRARRKLVARLPVKKQLAYQSWRGMVRRCYSPKESGYAFYGARGIKVCDRWRFGENGKTGYECFIADIGSRPSRFYSIDRIDVNGNYEPTNCRWADPVTQTRNRRNTVRVEYNGTNMPLIEACEAAGLPFHLVRDRLRSGMTPSRALTMPAPR